MIRFTKELGHFFRAGRFFWMLPLVAVLVLLLQWLLDRTGESLPFVYTIF